MKRFNVLLMISPMSQPRLGGIARFAREHGWYLMIQDRLGYRPLAWRGDGAIATLRASDPESLACVRRLRRRGVPVVDMTVERPELRIPRVMNDHAAIGRLAAEYFSERGFRNAAWFSAGWTNVHRLRFGGLAAGWDPARPPLRWVTSEEIPGPRFSDWTYFRRWLGRKLEAAPRPLAVLTYDEADAARLLNVCLELGISVPEEVAILSIGNEALLCESQAVPLSSVSQALEQEGYESARLLQKLMNGEPPPAAPILVPLSGVVTRQSTDTIAAEDPLLRQALLYVRGHLGTAFGLEQVAGALGVRRARLERLCREGLGHSLGREILRQRLAVAKLLLRNSHLTVAEIAARTGFCNPGYFINSFKKSLGATPRSWRKAPNPSFRPDSPII